MGFVDARALTAGATVDADICIVGCGAAGITIADALDGLPVRVVVLESGGFERDPVNQRLYRGEHVGLAYPPLEQTRLRYFGGTTNHWAGWCRPPREADLAGRRWLADSGWPIPMQEFEPYLLRAQEICDLGPPGFDSADWLGEGEGLLPLDDAVFETMVTRFSPPTRFAAKYRDRLERSGNVGVWLHANVIALGASANGRLIERLHCRTLAGNRFTVRPRYVVLATGGIENARLLLASTGISRRGVGNERDNVGRYFMDHFKFHVGTIELDAGGALDFYMRRSRRGAELKGVVGFAESVLEAHRIVPAHVEFHALDDRRYRIDVRLDPAPNRHSRIRLDSVVDRFGMPRVIVELRYGEIERRTFAAAVQLLEDGLSRLHIGRVEIDAHGTPPRLDAARVTATGFHHMGATRMSDDPARGVVDRNCRVHSVANLYVAGCSVFPGYAGYPTMTLVALAARLADHLKSRS